MYYGDFYSFKRSKYKATKSSGTSASSEGDQSSERVCTEAVEMVVKGWRRSQLGPQFIFLLFCTQAETFYGAWTQQHPRGPGVGAFGATHWSADCRLPDPSRESHGPDGPLQSRDRWAQSPSPAWSSSKGGKVREGKNALPHGTASGSWYFRAAHGCRKDRATASSRQQPSCPFKSFCIVSSWQSCFDFAFLLFIKEVSISLPLGTLTSNSNTVH